MLNRPQSTTRHRLSHISYGLGLTAMAVVGLTGSGCPAPTPVKHAAPAHRNEQFPWRLWSRRVDAPMLVAVTTKRRLVAVQYDRLPTEAKAKPVALVGLAPDTGDVLWTRKLNLKLEDPQVPWSYELAHKGRVLAVWLEGNKILGIDIYTGQDFWDEARPNSIGVEALGFGFVTVWKNKVYFLKPQSGKTMHAFSVPAVLTGPARITPEGALILMAGTNFMEMNLDDGRIEWGHQLNLPDVDLPVGMKTVGDKIVLSYRTVPLVETTQVTRADSTNLKQRWSMVLPGRVRTHHAVVLRGNQAMVLLSGRNGEERWATIDTQKGTILGWAPGRSLKACIVSPSLLFCPYANKSGNGVAALDAKTLKSQWKWETVDDISNRQHFWYRGVLYLAQQGEVVGLDVSGKAVFRAKVVWPGATLQVSKILGQYKGTLVVTAADWTKRNGIGELWGIDMKTGARKWRKRLHSPLYAAESAILAQSRVFYFDNKTIHLLRATNGRESDSWPHRLAGRPTDPPKATVEGSMIGALRSGNFAAYRLKDGRPMWVTKMPVGGRVLATKAGVLIVRTPDRVLHAHALKDGKEIWTMAWPELADPVLAAVNKHTQLFVGGRQGSVLVDPKTGKKLGPAYAVRHMLSLTGGDLLALQVHRRIPKTAQVIIALGVTHRRNGVKLTELWHKEFVRAAQADQRTGALWQSATPDLFLYKDAQDACVHALSADDGKPRWKDCRHTAVLPAAPYRETLYMGSGPFNPKLSGAAQGLLAIDPDQGKETQVIKLFGRSSNATRFTIHSPATIHDGVVYILTQGPRLRAIKVAK